MRRQALAAAFALMLHGCSGPHEISATELQEWYAVNAVPVPARPHIPLIYRGSDDDHHYFMCRPIDSFVFFMIPREDIDLADVRPRISDSGDPFPGYYEVDPAAGFTRN